MPRLACPCGYIHDLSSIPDDGFIVIWDKDFERLLEAHRVTFDIAGHDLPSDNHPRLREWEAAMNLTVHLYRHLYQCPRCGCILFEKLDSSASEFDCYVPDQWSEVKKSLMGFDPNVPDNDNPVMEATPYIENWVRCPNCGKRFSLLSAASWDKKRHRTCGQYLFIRESDSHKLND